MKTAIDVSTVPPLTEFDRPWLVISMMPFSPGLTIHGWRPISVSSQPKELPRKGRGMAKSQSLPILSDFSILSPRSE